MKKYIVVFCCIALLSGCAEIRPRSNDKWERLEPIVVVPSFNSNYLLNCLNDTKALKLEEFSAQFELAQADLTYGRKLDMLRFVCLGLNDKADYKQFTHGKKVLEQYLADNPGSGDDLLGFKLLVDRLDEEILNRWSAWKSLLNDKKELKAEVEALQIKIETQQKQIEQLKNIENIIKSRETNPQ